MKSIIAPCYQAPSRLLFFGGAFLAIWVLVIACYLPLKPIWLDELIHTHVSLTDMPEFLMEVAKNPGATPITYLPQAALFSVFPHSIPLGRLPSLIAYLMSLVFVGKLLGRRYPEVALLSMALFATSPILVRYATEIRPYAIFLMLSLILHVLYMHMGDRIRSRAALAYVLVTLLGVFTFPIFVAVPLWHATHAALLYMQDRTAPRERTAVAIPIGSILASAAFFFPWYIFVSNYWTGTIQEIGASGTISIGVLAVILREISGAGYLGIALAVPLIIIALRNAQISKQQRIFWSIGLIVPPLFAVFIDYAFGYFFAIRQIIVSLVPFCILSSFGIHTMMARSGRLATIYLAVVLLVFAVYSLRNLRSSGEDWVGAVKLALEKLPSAACIQTVPASVAPYLHAISTNADSRTCNAMLPLSRHSEIVVLHSRYAEKDPAALARLYELREHYYVRNQTNRPFFTIEVRVRKSSREASSKP